MKKIVIIIAVLILLGIGGYGIYSFTQNQKQENARLVQTVADIANSPTPQLNDSSSSSQQSPITTPPSINPTLSTTSWSHVTIDGKNVSYPSNWTVTQPEQSGSGQDCTENCLAGMQQVGALAVKLVPPGQTVGQGYNPNIIYIDTPGEGGVVDSGEPLTCNDEPSGIFMYCAQISDGVIRVPTGSMPSIVTEAQQIVSQSVNSNQ